MLQSLFDYLEPLDADPVGDVDFGPEAAADEAEVDFAAAPAVAPPAVQPLMADVTSSVVCRASCTSFTTLRAIWSTPWPAMQMWW